MFAKGKGTGQDVARLIRQLLKIPFLDGEFHEFDIAAGATYRAAHNLKRVPRGFINIGSTQDYNLRLVFGSDTDNKTFSLVNFSGDSSSLKIWIW